MVIGTEGWEEVADGLIVDAIYLADAQRLVGEL